MARVASLVIVIALALALAGSTALAQPGLGGSEHHATPPLPETLPSPLPSLPPPVRKAPGETPAKPYPSSDFPFAIAEAGFVAYVERDGRVRFSDGRASGGLLVDPIVGPVGRARFDVTDWLLGRRGHDPYATQKLAILEQTRPTRERMRANWEVVMMDRALADLPHYLQAVWRQQAWPAAVRRQILFELWDEAAEEGSARLRDGGVRARLIIATFIASRLPPGSEDAYSAAELARLNRDRKSRTSFAPYRDAGEAEERLAIAGDGSPALALMRRL
jgi:hypothetical protein